MSLRAFHILFIVTAIALLAFLGWWSGARVLRGEDSQNTALALVSAAGVVAGIPYLGWFIKKTKLL